MSLEEIIAFRQKNKERGDALEKRQQMRQELHMLQSAQQQRMQGSHSRAPPQNTSRGSYSNQPHQSYDNPRQSFDTSRSSNNNPRQPYESSRQVSGSQPRVVHVPVYVPVPVSSSTRNDITNQRDGHSKSPSELSGSETLARRFGGRSEQTASVSKYGTPTNDLPSNFTFRQGAPLESEEFVTNFVPDEYDEAHSFAVGAGPVGRGAAQQASSYQQPRASVTRRAPPEDLGAARRSQQAAVQSAQRQQRRTTEVASARAEAPRTLSDRFANLD